jgi:hypothetical protein
MQEGSGNDVERREMVEQIAARLKGEYDFEGLTSSCHFMSPTLASRKMTPFQYPDKSRGVCNAACSAHIQID